MTHLGLDKSPVDPVLSEMRNMRYLYLILKNAW